MHAGHHGLSHIRPRRNGAIDASITNEPTARSFSARAARCALPATRVLSQPQTAVLLYASRYQNRRPVALKFMPAYIQAVRFYNDASPADTGRSERAGGDLDPDQISSIRMPSSIARSPRRRSIRWAS